MKRLDQRFATPAPRRTHTVFLIDELDMLCKKKQTVLYNVFEWSSRPQAKVLLLVLTNVSLLMQWFHWAELKLFHAVLLFSTDPGPTCNNGYMKLFWSWTKYKPESTNSSYDDWLTKYFHSGKFLNKSEPSYWGTAVTIIWIFFFIKIYVFFSFRIKVGSGSDFVFQLSRIRIRGNNFGPSSLLLTLKLF